MLRSIAVPALVVLGGKDLQIDPVADGDPIRRAAAEASDAQVVLLPHANHVLKEERRELADIVPGTGYNEAGTHLDPEFVDVLLSWLAGVFSPRA